MAFDKSLVSTQELRNARKRLAAHKLVTVPNPNGIGNVRVHPLDVERMRALAEANGRGAAKPAKKKAAAKKAAAKKVANKAATDAPANKADADD